MAAPNMDVIKDIPGYKVILKAVLKSQIQQLVEQLATMTEEESVLLTASVSDGTLSHLGSDSGKTFLEDNDDIKSHFLGFCLKKYHLQKQKEKREKQEAERLASSTSYSSPAFLSSRLPHFTPPRQQGPRQQGPRPMTLIRTRGARMPVRGTPRMRHSPYPINRPPQSPQFDPQGLGVRPGPGVSAVTTPVSMATIPVIKQEPVDTDGDNSNVSVGETDSQVSVSTSVVISSQSGSSSDGVVSSDNVRGNMTEGGESVSSTSSPVTGSVTEQGSGDITDSQSQDGITPDVTRTPSGDALDPNVSVKLEAITDAEMELEITGVENANKTAMPSGSQDWGQGGALGFDPMGGATVNQGDMTGEQGYDVTNATKKRKAYSVQMKLAAVERIKKGESQAKVSRAFGMGESTLRGWLKEEEKLRGCLAEIEEGHNRKRMKRVRVGSDMTLDKAVMAWFIQSRAEGKQVSGPMLQEQAKKMKQMMSPGDKNFMGSSGWLHRFKNRHGISHANIDGKPSLATVTSAETYPELLKKRIQAEGYTEEQIYNCDETMLYFKILPEHTQASRDDEDSRYNFKHERNRLTVLLCANKTGSHKLMPLVVGKFERPRCFHHVNMANLPVLYTNSSHTWMTGTIFREWFYAQFVPAVKWHLKSKGLEQKAILLLDHSPAHPSPDLLTEGQITLAYLPKDITSRIQPLQQGVIATMKRNYRNNLTKAIVDKKATATQYVKQMSIKDAVHLLGNAWHDVSAKRIEQCWMKGLGETFIIKREPVSDDEDFLGFGEEEIRQSEECWHDHQGFSNADRNLIEQAFGTVLSEDTLDDWLNVDECVPTAQQLTVKQIVTQATTKKTSATVNCEEEEEDVKEEEEEEEEVVEETAENRNGEGLSLEKSVG